MKLNAYYSDMLAKIVAEKGRVYDEYMSDFGTPQFPEWKIGELCEWVNEEFLMNGLSEDGSPNQYGMELEGLLDEVNRLRLNPSRTA